MISLKFQNGKYEVKFDDNGNVKTTHIESLYELETVLKNWYGENYEGFSFPERKNSE